MAALKRTVASGSDNLQGEITAVAWVFTGLAIVTVFLKLFTRSHITRVMWGWDDFFIFLSLAMSIIASSLVQYAVSLGFGMHTADVLEQFGPERLVETARWQMLGYPFNILAFSFPNISIAILINNLLDPNTWRRRGLFAMVIMQVVIAFIPIIIIYVQCDPLEKLWNKTMPGTCWSPNVLNGVTYFLGAYTALVDGVLAFIPIAAFYKLQMRKNTKIGVSVLMSLTLLSAVVTIIKTRYVYLFTDATDPLYNAATLVNWGLVEQNVVIIAACVPTLRPFFHRAFKGEKLTYDRSGGSGGKSNPSRNTPSSSGLRYASASASANRDRDTYLAHTKGAGSATTTTAIIPLDSLATGGGKHPYDELEGESGSERRILRGVDEEQGANPISRPGIARGASKGGSEGQIWRRVDVQLEYEDHDDHSSAEWSDNGTKKMAGSRPARPHDVQKVVPRSLVEDPGYRERRER